MLGQVFALIVLQDHFQLLTDHLLARFVVQELIAALQEQRAKMTVFHVQQVLILSLQEHHRLIRVKNALVERTHQQWAHHHRLRAYFALQVHIPLCKWPANRHRAHHAHLERFLQLQELFLLRHARNVQLGLLRLLMVVLLVYSVLLVNFPTPLVPVRAAFVVLVLFQVHPVLPPVNCVLLVHFPHP